jgi:hypothetical protein
MMATAPLFASENSAARLLDLRVTEFRSLVRAGNLPRGREIAPGLVRWSVEDLRKIACGDATEGMGDVQW